MGSQSDWEVMKNTRDTLNRFGVPCECRVLSAHRTPAEACEFVNSSEENGVEVFIAAAGGAAHLAGAVAAHTVLPVLGVPMVGWSLDGLDSLLSTVQMPRGIPVATVAIGNADNAALLAAAILALSDAGLAERLEARRAAQTASVMDDASNAEPLPG